MTYSPRAALARLGLPVDRLAEGVAEAAREVDAERAQPHGQRAALAAQTNISTLYDCAHGRAQHTTLCVTLHLYEQDCARPCSASERRTTRALIGAMKKSISSPGPSQVGVTYTDGEINLMRPCGRPADQFQGAMRLGLSGPPSTKDLRDPVKLPK